jgi:hypothetical protein
MQSMKQLPILYGDRFTKNFDEDGIRLSLIVGGAESRRDC